MERRLVDADDLQGLFADLDRLGRDLITESDFTHWEVFRRTFFARLPLEEWVGRPIQDVFGAVYSAWRLLEDHTPGAPSIRLFNPNLEEDGWLCPHTVLLVKHADMPFLVDSIRIELNRRNIAIHSIKSTVIAVERNAKGQLNRLEAAGCETDTEAACGRTDDPGLSREALIYMEIRLHTDSGVLRDIRRSLQVVLNQVKVVVNDYHPLLAEAETAEAQLTHATHPPMDSKINESQAFLAWLRDNHFTFMGYVEYDIVSENGTRVLKENADKRLGLFRLDETEPDRKVLDDDSAGTLQFHLSPKLIAFSKSPGRSRVHRQAYSDYVVVKRFDDQGEFCGEARFLGLYTSAVYTLSPYQIPLIREKVGEVFERSGLDPASHDGKALRQILETFPRDELFQSSTSQLYEITTGVARINERYRVRLFVRQDVFGKFINCLIYVPRDLFTTRIRMRIQSLLGKALGAHEVDFNTYFSESILARVHLVFRVDPEVARDYDVEQLEAQIIEITRSWEDQLLEALTEAKGEERAVLLLEQYQDAFPSGYRDHFDARSAVQDIDQMEALGGNGELALSFYQPPNVDDRALRFKVFRRNRPMELSDVIPVLEHLGLRVVAEHPYEIVTADEKSVWMHNFHLSHDLSDKLDVASVRNNFQEAFSAVWRQEAESDAFNRLVLGARLSWREVVLLRALACYMRQTLFNFTEQYIASALASHVRITRDLVALFKARFDPRARSDEKTRRERGERLRAKIIKALDQVSNLNEDRIIRRYLAILDGCVRTNYFQPDASGQAKNYLSLKLMPREIADIPEPRPMFEIFVYSPRMEGVHLRAGKVARGGLRWSDRLQDYRTEVLGLVKAQQVKNAVIVPNGAKGGFVCKRPPSGGDRKALQQEAIACYQTFIRGLLDITDNLVEGRIQVPEQVVRLDEDDPYLVVAADKGTATFSDIANEISNEYHHWLGDAFASGGSQGYDHKAMGITARGAWVAVQRHFKELGKDIQNEDFTVVGVGDMAGDVFGNGMLLSKHICLVAAFNHMHIFIDPTPDAASSFEERQRLFDTPGTNWADYNGKLISKGGGVFSRDAKSIKISPQMRECFGIEERELTPTELISALLKAPVDLLWNGGIGTYVKASSETHAEVGDKANDSLRVDGDQLRCKVIGEGGNLGMTQLGRVEYALNGGACNTDFIDNAAGVDCSDHEVNIKILLNEVQENGDLTGKQRNQRLVEMTDQVAELVLHNNYRQTQAISVAASDALRRNAEYRRVMSVWQSQGRLDRKLEFLPDEETLAERQAQGQGLTRPELSVLISYAKVILKNDLAEADVADDPYLARFALRAFPEPLQKDFPEWIERHRLRGELVATQVANDLVNTMGLSFAQRLLDSTGVNTGDMAKAYVIARDIYQLDETWRALESLDYVVSSEVQMELMKTMMRRVRRAARWFLRNRRSQLTPQTEIEHFAPLVVEVMQALPDYLQGRALEEWTEQSERLRVAGVPEDLLPRVAAPGHLYSGLSIAEASRQTRLPLMTVTDLYLQLNEQLQLHDFARQISEAAVDNYWQAMARETYLDDLESQLRSLTLALCHWLENDQTVESVIEQWQVLMSFQLDRWRGMMNEVQNSSGSDYAIFSVALRELLDLVQITQYGEPG
ncbi:NAD-glutamate dehydrogenase [Marinimicrobium sp. C2-29]|uniref:NAD-glutamate dehydrogenase n=1 Tax=Marinimicrobium sp. C2-29 TaxID=3139825 RepID=UPI003138B541